jgi:hypothetical protein
MSVMPTAAHAKQIPRQNPQAPWNVLCFPFMTFEKLERDDQLTAAVTGF